MVNELELAQLLAGDNFIIAMIAIYIIMLIMSAVMFYWQWKQAKVKNIQERMLNSVLAQEGILREILFYVKKNGKKK